jgi:hypothetical protein
MAEPMAGGETSATRRKADAAATVLNKFLQNLVIKCSLGEEIRDYFDVGVIGYGASVGPAFVGALSGRDLVKISEIGKAPARIEERGKRVDDGTGGLVEQKVRIPIWFEPVANGGTPMCQALSKAAEIISGWTSRNQMGFPPVVVNVTDGESSDGEPSSRADAVKAAMTTDGSALLFNIHLSSKGPDKAIEYPDSDGALPDDFAKMLFGMSSPLTDSMQAFAKQKGHNITGVARGFVYNADLTSLIEFIDIGTRPANLR